MPALGSLVTSASAYLINTIPYIQRFSFSTITKVFLLNSLAYRPINLVVMLVTLMDSTNQMHIINALRIYAAKVTKDIVGI